MKKFKFSLDKLLNYKEQILDKEKNELSALRHKKQSAEEELLEVKNHLKVSNQNYIEKSQFEFTETYNAGNVIIRIQPSNNLFAVIMDSGTVIISDEFLIDLKSFL